MTIHPTQTSSKETFYMTTQDKRKEQVLKKLIAQEITASVAADTLDLSWRQVMRLKKRYKNGGIKAILHKNRGKPSNHAFTQKTKNQIMTLLKTSYSDFGPTLAAEELEKTHQIHVSVEALRTLMISKNIWTPKPRTPEKYPHTWRARKDCFGQMQQYDGSYFNWFEERLKDASGNSILESCLLVSVDDATGKLTGLKFAESEGVVPTMEFWQIYVKTHGKPISIYLDRFSTYKNNQKKNTVNTLELTQFQRACTELGIKVIHAHSPQAKGRVERMNQTLQDRLVKALRLKNICTIAEANAFMITTFIPAFNTKFGVSPALDTDVHSQLSSTERNTLSIIFSIQDTRIITNDYTIRHGNAWYQINPKQKTLVRVNDRVSVCRKLDGSMTILKNQSELEYTELPARPQKILPSKTPDKRLIGRRQIANHPWREPFTQKQLKQGLVRV